MAPRIPTSFSCSFSEFIGISLFSPTNRDEINPPLLCAESLYGAVPADIRLGMKVVEGLLDRVAARKMGGLPHQGSLRFGLCARFVEFV